VNHRSLADRTVDNAMPRPMKSIHLQAQMSYPQASSTLGSLEVFLESIKSLWENSSLFSVGCL
jgi:hypothetical protein